MDEAVDAGGSNVEDAVSSQGSHMPAVSGPEKALTEVMPSHLERSDELGRGNAELPFKYERVYDPEIADYREVRSVQTSFGDGTMVMPSTDEDIEALVRKDKEGERWYTHPDWREKGTPAEQIEITIGSETVTVYNFNHEVPFTDEHVRALSTLLQRYASYAPQILEKLKWVLIDDVQGESAWGNDQVYPLNGNPHSKWGAISISPRGMDIKTPHRIAAANNFEGTVAHELTHLIDEDFKAEWEQNHTWEWCSDNPEEWELRDFGGVQRWVNRETGVVSYTGQYPVKPKECVTDYARFNWREDVCDSLVAYMYDEELLRTTSEQKHAILQGHSENATSLKVDAKRSEKSKIRLPKIEPTTVRYYIEENA